MMMAQLQPVGTAMSDWCMDTESGQIPVHIPFLLPNQTVPQVIIIRTTLPDTTANALVIPRQSGNSIQVFLNDIQVYSVGDPSQPTANLWNYVHLIRLPDQYSRPARLSIHLSSISYGSGLNSPPFLSDYSIAARQVAIINWIANDSIWMISGGSLILGLLLFMFSAVRGKQIGAEFYTGICLLLSVVYVQDAVFRVSSGSLDDFLWQKKICMSAGYLGILFFLFSIEQFSHNRLQLTRWALLPLLPALVVIFVIPDLLSFDKILMATNVIMFALLVAAVVLLYFNQKSQPWMIFPTTLLLLSIMQMIFAIPMKWTGPLFIYPVILFTICIFGFNLIFEFHRIFRENVILRKEKNLDPLTGAMNRNILNEINPRLFDTLVMLDLNGFKEINDTYGHTFGDDLLMEFVQILQKNLRHDDVIIRYGGDEFLLLLKRVHSDPSGNGDLKRILQRIQDQYARSNTMIEPSFSYGMSSVGESLLDSVALADQRMYQMKQQKTFDPPTHMSAA